MAVIVPFRLRIWRGYTGIYMIAVLVEPILTFHAQTRVLHVYTWISRRAELRASHCFGLIMEYFVRTYGNQRRPSSQCKNLQERGDVAAFGVVMSIFSS